ncbi:MAG: DEAD/DEAH box helicase [Gemmobacter sp.]
MRRSRYSTKGQTLTSFASLGLAPNLLTALERSGFTTPTPIQIRAIPEILAGRDLMGLAQTGTGKTAAFGLPLLQRILGIGHPPPPRRVRALILAPTRELVAQIAEHLELFTKGSPAKVYCVTGGASLNRQTERLARGTDILVATPGRLIDLLERGALSLEHTGYLVLDEADQMLDMGFIHALRKIARHLPMKRQTLMFSATMPKLIEDLAATYLRDPVKVAVSPPGRTADRITQSVHFVNQGDKAKLLESLLLGHPEEAALVFGRTKHGSEKLKKLLESWGFAAGSIHGNKSQNQREATLKAFRDGTLKVLVATDVAARGIDIPIVRHVYNYDLPNVPDNYVHRIGRTARAGAAGRAVAFCAPAEIGELRAIEKVIGHRLEVAGGTPPASDIPPPKPARPAQGPKRTRPGKPPARPGGQAKPAQGKPGKPRAAQGQGQTQGQDKPGGSEAPRRRRNRGKGAAR